MDIDRAETNIGISVNANLESEVPEKLRQPARRFIGRRTAAERANKNEKSQSTIEDSGALQGLQNKCYLNTWLTKCDSSSA